MALIPYLHLQIVARLVCLTRIAAFGSGFRHQIRTQARRLFKSSLGTPFADLGMISAY
jgi:hypothetical protein